MILNPVVGFVKPSEHFFVVLLTNTLRPSEKLGSENRIINSKTKFCEFCRK
jgi:hypothetical protein